MADQTFDRNGLTSESVITGTPVYFITAFISLALYNVLELTGLIFTTFKKRKGLYFWSMIIATWGIALNATGFTLKFLKPDSGSSPAIRTLYTLLILVGWCGMVTGQSVVLYSRLYLLVRDKITLRFVLGMVIFDAILCHPPTIVLFVLTNSVDSDRYAVAYSIMEKCQLCVFFIQEVIISCIYIVESARFLKRPSLAPQRDRYALSPVDPRIVMRWLISINVIVIIFDMSVLGLEFSGYYDLQTSWKCLVYSVKLKLEFSILNKLIKVVKARNPDLFDDGVKLTTLTTTKDATTATEVDKRRLPEERFKSFESINKSMDRTLSNKTISTVHGNVAVEEGDALPADRSIVPGRSPQFTRYFESIPATMSPTTTTSSVHGQSATRHLS